MGNPVRLREKRQAESDRRDPWKAGQPPPEGHAEAVAHGSADGKHVLNRCLKEYIHTAVGVVGVSAGPFGGARVIQLLPVMRELGLVMIFSDVNVGGVSQVFGESGELKDAAYIRRTHRFLKELIWMAETLRHGREHIAQRA